MGLFSRDHRAAEVERTRLAGSLRIDTLDSAKAGCLNPSAKPWISDSIPRRVRLNKPAEFSIHVGAM